MMQKPNKDVRDRKRAKLVKQNSLGQRQKPVQQDSSHHAGDSLFDTEEKEYEELKWEENLEDAEDSSQLNIF
jgi:hypothetical protein